MSGHSKWATTKRQKGAADAKRGAIFTKLGKSISVAARLGGGDPEMNFRLRLAVDQAKAANVPKENIDRAIKRGTGEVAGDAIEQLTYEGFGPDGVAVIVECLTDNRNRTSSNLKHLFSKHGGNLGGPNSVSWLFEQLGVITVDTLTDEHELELIEAGVQDIKRESDGVSVYTSMGDLQKIKELLETKNNPPKHAEIEWVPKDPVTPTPATAKNLQTFFDALDDDEDVNNFYTNATFVSEN